MANPPMIVEGDLALVFGLSRLQGCKKDGEAANSWNRRRVVLRRAGGG